MNARLFANAIRKPVAPTTYQTTPRVTVKSTDCPHCDPTMRAWRIVRARWVAAGIDKGE